jgi:hypothetical protein
VSKSNNWFEQSFTIAGTNYFIAGKKIRIIVEDTICLSKITINYIALGTYGVIRMRFHIELIIVAILILLLIVPVSSTLNKVGAIPADAFINCIHDDTLYTGEGVGLRVYNIKSGQNLSNMDANSFNYQIIYPRPITAISASGDRLYLSEGGTLHILDISDRLHPKSMGNVTKNSDHHAINIIGNYAYVGGFSYLTVFDISDSNAPAYVRSIMGWSVPGASSKKIYRLANDGKYLYAAYGDPRSYGGLGFSIFDISNAGNPKYVSNFSYGGGGQGSTTGIAYYNNILYVAQYAQRLRAFDVTDRSKPKFLWNGTPGSPSAVDVQVSGHYLYVSNRYKGDSTSTGGGMYIYDISAPIPKKVGQNKVFTGYTEQITTNGDITAIARNTGGNNLYNNANKSNPLFLSNIRTPATSMALNAGLIGATPVLFAGGRNGGVWAWDISDPEALAANPQIIGSWYPSGMEPRGDAGVVIVDNYTFTTMDGNGAGIFTQDWTGFERWTPGTNPPYTHWGKEELNSQIISANKTTNRLYSATYAGIKVYDITNKMHPKLAGTIPGFNLPGPMYHGNYAITSDETDGIKFLDITNTKNFSVAAYYDRNVKNRTSSTYHKYGGFNYNSTSDILYAVWREGSGASYHVVQLDVSNMKNVHKIGDSLNFYGTFSAAGLIINGTDLFVSSASTGELRQYDISDPNTFRQTDSKYIAGGKINSMKWYQGYIYIFGESALEIYHPTPSARDPAFTQQTSGVQNIQTEGQAKTSNGVVGQQTVTQIAGFLNKVMNFLYRHFPIHI